LIIYGEKVITPTARKIHIHDQTLFTPFSLDPTSLCLLL
jgi:hypothetical protein